MEYMIKVDCDSVYDIQNWLFHLYSYRNPAESKGIKICTSSNLFAYFFYVYEGNYTFLKSTRFFFYMSTVQAFHMPCLLNVSSSVHSCMYRPNQPYW